MNPTRTLPPRKLLVRALLVAAIGITAAVALADGGEALLSTLLQRPAAEKGTIVVPDRFLRQWDPVTIFFLTDKGPAGGGPEDHPEKYAKVEPAHPGAWTWIDAKTLQFKPAEPWSPLDRASWTVEGRTWDLATLLTPPIETVPSNGSVGLDPVESIGLTFATPLPPDSLARMVTVELKPLPGIGDDAVRWLGSDEFEVKALERTSASEAAQYTIDLHAPIPLGTSARVRIGLSLDEGSQESVSYLEFSTAEPFRPERLGCHSLSYPIGTAGTSYSEDQPLRCSSGVPEVRVEFSVPPANLGPVEARNLVRFEPTVEGLSHSPLGNAIVVRGRFQSDTLYKVTLVPTPLLDAAKRPLEMEGESSLFLFFPRKSPTLRWDASQGIAEVGGPKRIPMQGRGHDRADLRIYRLDPTSRDFWPFPETSIPVDETGRPPAPGEEPEPWTQTWSIGADEIASRIAALGTPGISTLVDLPLEPDGSGATFGLDVGPALERLSGKEEPGHYLVGVRPLDGSTQRSWMRLQVTDLALTTIESASEVRFVVTSLSTGAPVAGAEVRIEGTVDDYSTSTWTTLASGRTAADGALDWNAPGWTAGRSVSVQRIVVEKGSDVLVLDPASPPEVFARGGWDASYETWLQWAYDSLEYRGEQPVDLVHLFPERPVYRPGETVHLKGWIRTRHLGSLSPHGSSGTVLVRGPGGTEWRLPVELTAAGGFYAAWIEEEPPTGTYHASFENAEGMGLGRTEFRVEAYAIPTFEVAIHGPDRTGLDGPFDLEMTATYYAGGRVAERPVRWRVTQYPLTWTPKAVEGFLFSSDGRYSRMGRFESTPTITRDSVTDETGRAPISLDPSIEPTAQPRTYVVEATVTGADDQTVTATHRVDAVPAFVVGLKVERFLEKATKISPQILVVGPDAEPLAGQEVTVRLIRRQWHSTLQAGDFTDGVARYLTDVVDEPVSETKIRSGTAPVVVDLPIGKAGVYIVEAESHDKIGRAQVVSADLYAGGEEPLSWTKPEAGVFELSADAEEYEPGDIAQILLKSPFQSGEALAVVETPRGNRYQAVKVRGGKATLRVPIEKTWVPRIPIHVVLERGRVAAATPSSETSLDLGKPSTVTSSIWLKILPVENTVKVGVEIPPKALPGETVPVTVTLKDPAGRPLSGEVTLWLVDQAVLALGKEQRLDPLPDFIRDRDTYVAIRDTRNLAFGRVPYAEMPGGDGEEYMDEDTSPLDNATVRRNFTPVPFYEPAIGVGPTGTATVQVELPDNLTIFKVRAKAASGPDRFGAGTSEIAVRLPLVVQPALPRFVRPGDSFEAAAVGRVVEGPAGPGAAQIEVQGLTLRGPAKASVEWDAVTARRVAFGVDVPTPRLDESGRFERREVVVRFGISRAADGAADAFEVRLPIEDDRRAVTERLLADLDAKAPLEVPALSVAARPGSVRRTLVVADHPGLVRMASALDFLRQTPVGNTEQRITRARVYLGLGELRSALGMHDAQDEIDEAVTSTLEWIPSVVDRSGLVAYWPGAEGRVALTAWTLVFLVEAREGGYPVDARLITSFARTLQGALRSDYRYFVDGESWYERCLALEALSASGQYEDAYFAELAREARTLDLEATSAVLLAGAHGGQGKTPMAAELTRTLADGVIVTLYQGRETYGGLKEGRTDRNPRILPSEARTLASITRALGRVNPEESRLPVLVDALVQLGTEDGWGNTNTNGAALLALSERLSRSASPPAKIDVIQDGRTETLTVQGDAPVTRLTSDSATAVKVALKSGATTPIVALASTRYVPEAPGSEVAPASKGFVVTREALRVSPTGAPPERIALESAGSTVATKVGDVIEDHVQVVNPEMRHYVAVVVPLAAGMEPLNPRLATAPPEATPANALTRTPSWAGYYDDRVVFAYEELPKGTYDFYFRTRATAPGTYVQPAAYAEMTYDPATTGNSAGAKVVVEPATR